MCDCKNKTCNFCQNAFVSKIDCTAEYRYNIYCKHSGNLRMIDVSVPNKAFVEIPEWCPIQKNGDVNLTHSEKLSRLRSMQPFIKWEDIKENTIYHIPQLPGDERKDIFITSKTATSCQYKIVNDSPRIIYTLYPSTLAAKLLIKNKIV